MELRCQSEFDLLDTGLRMLEMNGLELVSEVRKRHSQAGAIIARDIGVHTANPLAKGPSEQETEGAATTC
jgi:hypothetical protein